MKGERLIVTIICIAMFLPSAVKAQTPVDSVTVTESVSDLDVLRLYVAGRRPLQFDDFVTDTRELAFACHPYELPDSLKNPSFSAKGVVPSIYGMPYSFTARYKDWHRLWINTAVLTGAFVGTLMVLECLPEDATTWNRAEIRNTPLFKRWYEHVLVKGPEWDHDRWIFNFVLHPYAGAVYFMSARSCGFNFWQSLLYCSIISDVGWEFGIEAFMEQPSYQDMFITPIVGSAIGEACYALKRHIVNNDYRLFGSPVVGNVVAFIIDPVNELVGFFDHNPARAVARKKKEERGENISFMPMVAPGYGGFSLVATF